jgi:hypothetical protein
MLTAGCLGFLHPLQTPPEQVCASCRDLPECYRDHVHVLIVNGMDPADVSNLTGMCQYIRDLGFTHPDFGQFWHMSAFRKRLHEIADSDSEARIVLIGYSFGVSRARSLAQYAKKEGIRIDLLIYLDACTCNHTPEHHPDDARRIVNVTTQGFLLVLHSAKLEGVENYSVDCRHLALPACGQILELVARELSRVAHQGPGPHLPPVELAGRTTRPIVPPVVKTGQP